jgi:predicted Zn-dependent protease
MKTIFRLLSVLAAAYLSFFRLADRHPPPIVPETELRAYVSGADLSATGSECQLDPNFEPVNHTARRQVQAVFYRLALAAGNDPDSYSIELMRDRRGHRAINAMTCTDSRVIWISVTAWERLGGHEPALALMLAHELAHANHRHPATLKNDQMTAAEQKLHSRLTPRQTVEIAADQRAADLMVRAGYTASQINKASHYILTRDEIGMLSKSTVTHPSGRDRINLMTFYLGRKMLPQFAR